MANVAESPSNTKAPAKDMTDWLEKAHEPESVREAYDKLLQQQSGGAK